MKTYFEIIDKEGVGHVYSLDFFGGIFREYFVDGVVYMHVYKMHNHHYDIKCFFYDKRYIYYRENIRTKKELYDVIQKLLQENLYGAVQKNN